MKKVRLVITGILIIVIAFGWILTLSSNVSELAQYNKNIENARVYVEKGLYQKAIASYEAAIVYKSKVDIYDELLDTYKKGLDDGVVSSSEYSGAYEAVCTVFPKEIKYWEILLKYYLDNQNFSKAYDVYKNISKVGVQSETISGLVDDLLYSVQIKPKNYSEYIRTPSGFYTVRDEELWGILYSDGETFSNCAFDYIVPISSGGDCVLQSAKGTRVYSSDGVVQYIIKEIFSKTHSFSSGLVCAKTGDNEWKYYNTETDSYCNEKYENASAFTSGVAAVKNGGSWSLIDTSFKEVSKSKFDNVKLYQNGEYTYLDTMIASQGGNYKMFNSKGESLNDFAAADMDNYYGGLIAFKDSSGLWGYVDLKGNILIKPQFKQAKSFSNGLAAVYNGTDWGFIKADGTVVIDYQYETADYFTSDGYCMVGEEVGSFNLIALRYV